MCLIVSLYFSVYQLHVLSKAVRSSKAGFGEIQKDHFGVRLEI